ncbi:hypothetical protein RYZ27_01210 [Hyphomonas sp. FCG-A18]|uniref:hypothetical protein n=1 Tax=Hyphomonas sp. FCG-A18 TaxID=3080019 RepID=UPI002B31BD64|nr:hypothetical protein RYZ27_01210 [Hyphomonas sp. FCG-A18]
MSQVKLTAVDQTMAFSDPKMPQDLIDAWSYTTTFAQAAARHVNPDPSSDAYFKTMRAELSNLGWIVTDAGRLNYNQSSNKIEPATIVKSILNPYLSGEQQKQLAGILDAIKQPDVKATGFLDFWWKKASTHADKANMAMGPLTEVNNSANISMIHYGFNFDASSWRSLFVESSTAKLDVSAFNIEMNLNLDLYNREKSALISKISGKVDQHIDDTVLDL